MKKLIIIAVFLLALSTGAAHANEMEEMIDKQLDAVGTTELQHQLDRAKNRDYDDIIPEFDIKEMARGMTKGEWGWDVGGIMKRAAAFYFGEFLAGMKIMLSLIALSLMCALTDNLQRSFSRDGIGEAAFHACFLLTAAVAVGAFNQCVSVATGAIDDMVVFMNALIPVTLSLLAASGAVASAGVFHPVLALSVQVISMAFKTIVIPFILIYAALSIANNISGRETVGRMAKLFKNAAKWIMGIVMTAFVGVIAVQGLVTPSIDGISKKTVKFAVGNFIPVVGGVLAETVDLVFGCTTVLKNAVGVTGLIAVVGICSVPVVRLLASASLFALAPAIVEPVTDKRIVSMLSHISEAVTMLFVAVAVVTVMFVISLIIVIGAGNTAAVLGR